MTVAQQKLLLAVHQLRDAAVACSEQERQTVANTIRSGPLWTGNQFDGDFGLSLASTLDGTAEWQATPHQIYLAHVGLQLAEWDASADDRLAHDHHDW